MTARRNIEFAAHDGVLLRGWLYLPETASAAPGIVMSHGFSATREMGLKFHAQALTAAGMAVLLYDHRCLGESEGTPRQLIDPMVQTRDMMAAIGWLAARPQVDAARIGLWGTSYSGAQALILAALDARVRAVATIVPAVGQPGAIIQGDDTAWKRLAARIRSASIDPAAVSGVRAVVPEADGAPGGLMPDPDTTAWMLHEGGRTNGSWKNAVITPVRPDDVPFDPAPALAHLQAPVLIVAGSQDRVTPAADARIAAELAGDKVEFLVLDGHHCSFYGGGPGHLAGAAVQDFFARQL